MARIQHPLEIHGMQTLLDDGITVKNTSIGELLFAILGELKYLNQHMQALTEEEVEEDDYQRL